MTIVTSQSGLTIEAYSSGTTRIDDPGNELILAEGLSFANAYPGGDMDAAFTVKRDIVAWWALKGAQRVAFRQGQRIIYEGYVSSLDRLLDEGGQAIRVPLVGGWAHILMNRHWHKPWADKRIDEAVWRYQTDAATYTPGVNKCNLDRNTRIRFTPKAEAWLTGEVAVVRYTAPVNETVKQLTYDYDLAESAGANDWEIGAYRSTDAVNWTLIAEANGDTIAGAGTTTLIDATGTGSIDATLGTASRYVEFRFYARDNQTPTSDGTYYGQFSNIVVKGETGAIDPTEVTKDVIGHFTALNTSTVKVGSNTLSIIPFFSEWDTAADIVTRACSFGDASNNRWAALVYNSEHAATPDGKPLLGIEQYPALTDYDLALRLGETNIAGAVEINQDFGNIINNVIVEYADENGWANWITPTDQATLTNAASIALYGQRDYLLSLGYSTSTVALSNGVRLLNAYKDPQWNASPIPIWDYIRKKSGEQIPPARIRAGQRLKIENFTQDLSGTGLTLLITGTRYDDESGVCTLTFGQPASPLLTILSPPPRIIEDMITGGGGDTGGGTGGGGSGPSPVPVGWGGKETTNFKNIKKYKKFAEFTGTDMTTLKGSQKNRWKKAARKWWNKTRG